MHQLFDHCPADTSASGIHMEVSESTTTPPTDQIRLAAEIGLRPQTIFVDASQSLNSGPSTATVLPTVPNTLHKRASRQKAAKAGTTQFNRNVPSQFHADLDALHLRLKSHQNWQEAVLTDPANQNLQAELSRVRSQRDAARISESELRQIYLKTLASNAQMVVQKSRLNGLAEREEEAIERLDDLELAERQMSYLKSLSGWKKYCLWLIGFRNGTSCY